MTESAREAIVAQLGAQRVVPVLRLASAEQTLKAVECLAQAGFATVEITLTTPGALELIRALAEKRDATLLVGAGTVLDAKTADACIRAGAQFLVSPCAVAGLVERAHEAGKLGLLGGFTPGEIQAAHRAGADVVKLFPASSGGPAHLAAVRAVFPHIPLCPTGGVNAENMKDYLAAGAAFVGVGNSIIDVAALDAGDTARVIARAKRFLQI